MAYMLWQKFSAFGTNDTFVPSTNEIKEDDDRGINCYVREIYLRWKLAIEPKSCKMLLLHTCERRGTN